MSLCYTTNNQLKTIFICLFILLFFCGCSALYTKDNYISDFKAFVDKVEKNYEGYKETDWVAIEKTYQKFAVEDYETYKEKLTETDKNAIGKLKGAYNMIKLKKEAKNIFENTKDIVDQAAGFIEGSAEKLNK